MEQLGFAGKITELITPSDYEGFELARVILEHRERYVVQTTDTVRSAEVTGNLRFSANDRRDFPAVGDWVKIMVLDESTAIILAVFPRTSILERQAVGKVGEVQVIASNIDCAFIAQSFGHDLNLNRLERYLAICHAALIEPVILLTKADLVEKEEQEAVLAQVRERVKGIPVLPISIETEQGLAKLQEELQPYRTYCIMGSSGVGKSTLVNWLKGIEVLKTGSISSSTDKGKHTTSHRELIVLPNGSIIVDTPGMRELGMVDNAQGVELTYDEILAFAENCKFNDCTHTEETGCAVLQAVDEGEISPAALDNFQKLLREQTHFSSSIQEKRRKSKAQGKLYKSIQEERRKQKY